MPFQQTTRYPDYVSACEPLQGARSTVMVMACTMPTIPRSRRTTRGNCEDATASDPMQTTSSPSSDANSSQFDTSEAAGFDKQVRLGEGPPVYRTGTCQTPQLQAVRWPPRRD